MFLFITYGVTSPTVVVAELLDVADSSVVVAVEVATSGVVVAVVLLVVEVAVVEAVLLAVVVAVLLAVAAGAISRRPLEEGRNRGRSP
jgi:hypothetical protein